MTVEIALPKHKETTIVDDVDSDLARLRWYLAGFYRSHDRSRGYAVRAKGQTIMHRVILERMMGRPLLRGEFTDHVNRDTLDNRRSNLRLATLTQNLWNRQRSKRNTSGHTGVYWDSHVDKWRVQICVHRKRIALGAYSNLDDAIAARREAERRYLGDFAP